MSIQFFFSNRMEALHTELLSHLFAGTTPFAKRLIIVPTAAMKGWLLRRSAEDPQRQIAAGLQVGYLEPMLDLLYRKFATRSASEELVEPDAIEIALALEQELLKLWQEASLSPALQEKCASLLHYLGLHSLGAGQTKKVERRASALATTLAHLFRQYALYGGQMLAAWPALSDWQQLLWNRLEERFHCWNYPYRKFTSFAFDDHRTYADWQVSLFGLSYLPPLYHRFLLQVAQKVRVHYYLLSPCLQFWSDMLSSKESSSLQKRLQKAQVPLKQREALKEYLDEQHPLLANLGKVGREMALQIEVSAETVDERYLIPPAAWEYPEYRELIAQEAGPADQKRLSLLEALQTDLLLLRNPTSGGAIAYETYDGTIQVHACASRSREVHALYNIIMGLLERHQHDPDPLRLGDIVVMSPNISDAAPYIQSVFGAPESCLHFQLMEQQVPAFNELIKGFLHLLQLPASRWDAAALLRLLEFPSFQAKHRFKQEECLLICKWVQEAGICWGKDAQQRHALLQRDHCRHGLQGDASIGSWEHGFNRLLDKLLEAPNQYEAHQCELLGRFIALVHSLIADLQPLSEGTRLTLAEWSCYLRALCDAYFQPELEEAQAGARLLLQQLDHLAHCAKRLKEELFGFPSISRHLLALLHTQNLDHREKELQAVRFCSLHAMRSVPAKVVMLMGMEEGTFPGSEESLSLNLLHKSATADYCPSKNDFDRYQFLEALISARRYLIISYLSRGGKEIREHAPCPPVQELLAYLDSAFTWPQGKLSTACHYIHPKHPFDRLYFTPGSRFQSYFPSHYQALLAHENAQPKQRHNFISSFYKSAALPEAGLVRVDLADLLSFAKSPIKRFLANQGFNFFTEGEPAAEQDEELSISHMDLALLCKLGLFEGTEQALAWGESVGKLPQGPFNTLNRQKIARQIQEYKESLASDGSWTQLRFNETGKEFQPLVFDLPGGKKVRLVGQIEAHSSVGLVLLDRDELAAAVAKWPLILTYALLVDQHQLPFPKRVVFAKTNKVREIAFADARQSMCSYLTYYLQAHTSPSPLFPDWVEPILSGSLEELQTAWTREEDGPFAKQFDEPLKWLQRSSPGLEMRSALENWQSTCHELFGELARWLSGGSSSV